MPYPYYSSYYQPQTQNNGIVWVQGESGAKSFLIAPNTTVLLMDSESNKFYLKSADASGVPLPLRKFSYAEDSQEPQNDAFKVKSNTSVDYDAKSEIEALKSEIATLKDSIKKMKEKPNEQFDF